MFKTVWTERILINFSITDPLFHFLKEICRSQKFIRSVWSRSGIRYQVMLFESCQVIKVFLFDWWTCKHQTIWVVIAFASVWEPDTSFEKMAKIFKSDLQYWDFTFGCPAEDWLLDSIKYSGLQSCFKLYTSKIGPQNHLSHTRTETKKCRAWFFL